LAAAVSPDIAVLANRGRTVPLAERWVPPLTGTLVWVALYMLFDRREREAPARL